jgi:hypothetical protein
MFKCLIKGLLAQLAVKLLDNYRHLSIQLLRIEAAKSYLRGVQLARQSAIVLMRTDLAIALISLGVVLVHIGLFILLPWTVTSKALLGIILGLAYILIGTVALSITMSEKTWMEKSGADELLKEVTGQSTKG